MTMPPEDQKKINETGELINESDREGGGTYTALNLVKDEKIKVCSECEIRSEGALTPSCASIYEDAGHFNDLAEELDKIEGRPDF